MDLWGSPRPIFLHFRVPNVQTTGIGSEVVRYPREEDKREACEGGYSPSNNTPLLLRRGKGLLRRGKGLRSKIRDFDQISESGFYYYNFFLAKMKDFGQFWSLKMTDFEAFPH